MCFRFEGSSILVVGLHGVLMGFILCLFWHVACDHMSFKRFLGVINLAKSGTIEADALLNLNFVGVKPSRGFNLFKHPSDERRKNLEKSIEGLKSLINFSNYVLPLNADISRLEFKEIIKGGKSDEDLKNTTENLLKDIWLHATCQK